MKDEQTFVPYKVTSLSKILAVSSVVMVELKHVTMTRPNRIQVKHTSRPNSVFGIRSPYLAEKKIKIVTFFYCANVVFFQAGGTTISPR